jgi:hypothetical protein
MDAKQFETITKAMGRELTRRRALGRLVAGVAATSGLAAGLRSATLTGLAAQNDNEGVCDGLDSGKIDVTDPAEPTELEICASGNLCVTGYCVKAGSINSGDGPEYTELVPPLTQCVTIRHSSGKAISHYSYSEGPCGEEETAQWCSPGYWRQEQHLGSWDATGYSPTDKYNAIFGANLDGDPTLWDVLQSPNTYGGNAFNKVGDLLSEAHPDINFQGERVEDSCPLGRDEG